jgi:hypothetical protein
MSTIRYRKCLSHSKVTRLLETFPGGYVEGKLVRVGWVAILCGSNETTVVVPRELPFRRLMSGVTVGAFALLGLAVGIVASDASPMLEWLETTSAGVALGVPVAWAFDWLARKSLVTFGDRVGVAVGNVLYH